MTRVTKVTTTRSLRQMPVPDPGDANGGYYFDPQEGAALAINDYPLAAHGHRDSAG